MNDILHIGEPPLRIHLRNNNRAKRYSLRISNSDGKVSLTMPRWSNLKDATTFAISQEKWLRKHLSRGMTPIVPSFDKTIIFEGNETTIKNGQGRSVIFIDKILYVPGNEDQLPFKLKGYFRTLARERFVNASEYYASMLDKKIGSVSIRDTRSRWGSCSSEGKLMYSWRLIMAPLEVQNYVAAHEVCHLIEMNHSHAYWSLVNQIFPEYENPRRWLKQNGTLLHRYLF